MIRTNSCHFLLKIDLFDGVLSVRLDSLGIGILFMTATLRELHEHYRKYLLNRLPGIRWVKFVDILIRFCGIKS